MNDRVGEFRARVEILANNLPPHKIIDGHFSGRYKLDTPRPDVYVYGALYTLKATHADSPVVGGGYYFLSTYPTQEGSDVRRFGHSGVLYQELRGDDDQPWRMSVLSTIRENSPGWGLKASNEVVSYRGAKAKRIKFQNPTGTKLPLSYNARAHFEELSVSPETILSILMGIEQPTDPIILSAIPILTPRLLAYQTHTFDY